jgi:hypothetical protein
LEKTFKKLQGKPRGIKPSGGIKMSFGKYHKEARVGIKIKNILANWTL